MIAELAVGNIVKRVFHITREENISLTAAAGPMAGFSLSMLVMMKMAVSATTLPFYLLL